MYCSIKVYWCCMRFKMLHPSRYILQQDFHHWLAVHRPQPLVCCTQTTTTGFLYTDHNHWLAIHRPQPLICYTQTTTTGLLYTDHNRWFPVHRPQPLVSCTQTTTTGLLYTDHNHWFAVHRPQRTGLLYTDHNHWFAIHRPQELSPSLSIESLMHCADQCAPMVPVTCFSWKAAMCGPQYIYSTHIPPPPKQYCKLYCVDLYILPTCWDLPIIVDRNWVDLYNLPTCWDLPIIVDRNWVDLYNLPTCWDLPIIVDCTEWTSIIYPHVETSPSL